MHKRVGTFEEFYSRKQHDHLKTLTDYVISQQYSHLHDARDPYAQFFSEVVEQTARYRDRLWSEESRDDERCDRMNRVNPKYVLRNDLAQPAIEQAQHKDCSEVDRLFTLLQNPYSVQPEMETYALPPPNWGKHLSVNCSS